MFDIARDTELWKRVRTHDAYARHRKEIKEKYDKVFSTPPRPRSAKEVLENNDHGTYHANINRLQCSALMALIYPDNEEYYDNLVETVWAYCEEYSWAPLGHYTPFYYGVSPEDYDPGLIDIFAASVAFSMAEIKSLFRDRFPRLLKDRITAEIRRRTIEPFVNRRYFWESHNNNWTAVCTGAVGGTVMYEDPELFMKLKPRFDSAMECYLASYKDDGLCVEGPAYWGFGFGFFASYAMLLKEFSKGEYDYFKRPKVRAISTYIQKMLLQNNIIALYSDCNVNEGYWIGLPHMMKTVYPNDVECLPADKGTVIAYSHLCFSLRSIVYYNPDYVAEKLENKVYAASCYFTKRTDYYGFSTKGGSNNESHNHNDVGTFILAKNNKEVICDLGYIGPCETPGYHKEKRYEYFNPSSFSHSVPYFNGFGQDGTLGCEDDVILDYNEKECTVSMELACVYSTMVPALKRLERSFTLTDSKIILKDRFEASEPTVMTERFVAVEKPTVIDGRVICADVCITSDGVEPRIVEVPFVSQVKRNGTYDAIAYCIEFPLPEGRNEITVTFDAAGDIN